MSGKRAREAEEAGEEEEVLSAEEAAVRAAQELEDLGRRAQQLADEGEWRAVAGARPRN